MSNSRNQHVDQELLVRYLSKETTPEENSAVSEWIHFSDQNRKEFDQLRLIWNASGNAKSASSIDSIGDWQKVKSRINETTKVKSMPVVTQRVSSFKNFVRVAAVVALLVVGYLGWSVFTDLMPVDMTTITALTDTSSVMLPDGSLVVLNRNSRLIYPKEFRDSRTVMLEGEAFFDVAEDRPKPFLIKSGEATTEVVGTSFSVHAGIKNKILVTVVTGKVLLYKQSDPKDKLVLTPGEQGQLKDAMQLTKMENEDHNFLSWKTGVLTFRNTPIDEVIKDLNTQYDQAIKLGSSALKTCTLTATFNNETLESVLNELKLVLPIQILKQDEKIILTGTGCR